MTRETPGHAIRVAGPSELAPLIEKAAAGSDPFLLAVAGPPGSRKSTIAEKLCQLISRPSCVVPMDGFHMANEVLEEQGLLSRKGAPETFDLASFAGLVDALRDRKVRTYPTFDRAADCVVAGGGSVSPGTEILIFEGNYLAFNEPGWAALQRKWDATVWLDVPEKVLRDRLTQRWRDHGLSEEAARDRAEQNDMRNATRITHRLLAPTWIIGHARETA